MTTEITLVFGILGIAIVLFVSERIRVDLVALLILCSLAITGLVTPTEALSGFSNLAVVTVWAVFILSGGLARTGVAKIIGRQILRLAGESEIRLLVVIMLTASILSGFMNSIGVVALFLPVVISIARTIGLSPSKLLMPLAFAALLGGLTTQIGTPPNILISEALKDAGLITFGLFDYTPVGAALALTGIAFMALIGRHLLPKRDIVKDIDGLNLSEKGQVFDLQERLSVLSLPAGSGLIGKTLSESRIGSALELNVLGIIRSGQTQLAPESNAVLETDDQLIVAGRLDRLSDLHERKHLVLEDGKITIDELISSKIAIAEIALSPNSLLIEQTITDIDFRQRYGVIVLSIWRNGFPLRTGVKSTPLQSSDVLLVQGLADQIEALKDDSNFLLSTSARAEAYRLDERMMNIRIPKESTLVGNTLAESRLAVAFGLTVLGIARNGETNLMPSADERLEANDTLIVKGKAENLSSLRGLEKLQLESQEAPALSDLESEEVGLVEVVLSPISTIVGQTLAEIRFREKYGLAVLAFWREGRAEHANVHDTQLRFGDALLLHGPRQKILTLGREPDFLVLAEEVQEPPRLKKAPIASLIMVTVLTTVILGWLPIAIAAIAGVTLMVLTGCLSMAEAYRYIEWKAIFLIAGMLPLGIAMERTGAAQFLAEWMVNLIGGLGPLAILAGIFILAALSSQVMPNPAVAVLLAPIALNIANNIGVSPYPFMMTVALSASAAFLSPVGHSANIIIMGPGGYRFADYLRVGTPLTLLMLIVTVFVLPVFWPF
ncbi:MAG: SLC13 family permease [Chloroflexi bacterium]|nr:SLC13 family permease [Chloroflexota bacterium]